MAIFFVFIKKSTTKWAITIPIIAASLQYHLVTLVSCQHCLMSVP